MYDDRRQRTAVEEHEWILGARRAPVTILEYGDFECPYCAATRPVLAGLVAEAPRVLRLVYRHFPIATIHPHATLAAEAAEAAGAQGEFWRMHDMLFEHRLALEPDDLVAYADGLGLDLEAFSADLAGHVHLPEVRRDFRRGIMDGANGTPSLFINGLRYDGPRDAASLRTAIARIGPARDWTAQPR